MISLKNRLISSSAAIAGGLLIAAPAMAQPVQLGPVQVEDAASRNAQKRDLKLSTSPTTSIQDTPQAVTVIDAQTMKAQATTTLGEALRNVPGITIAIGEGGTLAGDQFKLRGFDAKDDIYIDGLRDFGVYTRDAFNYQEVQVLKGPSGLMFGRGTTGGAINTVSKTPFLRDNVDLHIEGGNGDRVRGTADINYQLGDTSAVRLNLMAHDSNVVDRDLVHAQRWGVAGSIALGLGTDTNVIASYIHQHTNSRQDYGLVVAQPPGSIYAMPVSEFGVPRSNFLGFRADKDKNDADIVTVKASHVANDWLTITNDARVGVYSRYFQYTATDRCTTDATTNFCSNVLFGSNPTSTLAGIGGGGPYQQNSWGMQDIFAANASFEVGGLRNQLITGIDVSYQNADRTIYAYLLPTTSQYTYQLGNNSRSRSNIGRNLFNPDPNTPPGYTVVTPNATANDPNNFANTNATATTVLYSTGRATDLAFFLTDRLWFNDELSLIAGVRVDNYKANFSSILVNGTASTVKAPSNLVNPRASLVWEPTEDQTYYFSYGKSAVPIGTSVVGTPTPLTTANNALDPEKSENFELGAKVTVLDGLGLTASIFQVQKANALIRDVNGDATLQSGQKQRVRGFEASATGTLTDNFSISAAYTYLDPVVTQDLVCLTTTPAKCWPNTVTIGQPITFVPKHGVSIWGDYSAKDWLEGLSFGGGFVYQSPLHNAFTVTSVNNGLTTPPTLTLTRAVVIPETVELDAVVSYDFGNYRVQFNVNNLTDELNYSQSFGNRGTPAPGRSFIIALDAKL